MKKQFEYVEIPAKSNVNRSGATIENRNEYGVGHYHINGLPVVEVIRKGNNSNTAGGNSSVGYQIDGKPETRQKSFKKLIESLAP